MYKKLILAAVGAAAVVTLAACSSTGSGTTPTPSASGDATEAPFDITIRTAQSTQKDFSSGGIDWMVLHDSLPAGITLTQNVTGQVAQALATGDVDIVTTSPSRLLPAMLQGLPVTIVGTTEGKWDQVVVVGKEYAGDVKDPCDIKGAKVGITANGSAGDLTTISWAKKCGFTEGVDFTKTALGDVNAVNAAFTAGQINFFPYGGLYAFALTEDQGYPSFRGDLYVDMPTSVIAVRNDFLAQNPKAVRAFCDTYYGENAFVRDNEAEAVQQYMTWGNVSEAAAQGAVEFEVGKTPADGLLAYDSDITDSMFQGMITAVQTLGEASGTAQYLDLAGIKKFYQSCDSL